MKKILWKLGIVEEKRYAPARGYSPGKDDLYRFDERDCRSIQVAIIDGSFELPESATRGQTALLAVRAKCAMGSRWRSPNARLLRDDCEPVEHHFDARTNALRFLDISALLEAPESSGRRVTLHTNGVRFHSSATLLLFERETVGDARVLVLSAHPDDGEIAAFGLYSNAKSAVVTLTAGDAGRPYYQHIVPDLKEQSLLKQRLRVWDSVVVPLWGGVDPTLVANLGYFDTTLEKMRTEPDRPFTSRHTGATSLMPQRSSFGDLLLRDGAVPTWRSLVADLAHILSVYCPDIIVTPHPLFDAHTDHKATTMAVLEALQQQPCPRARLFLYVNHAPFCNHWPFGPPCRPASLPPWPLKEAKIRGLYSHPLRVNDQVNKLFALESMHDLRRPPPSVTRDKEWGMASKLWEMRDAWFRQRLGSFSYFRRGVRAREIFFVYPAEDAHELINDSEGGPKLWE